MKYDPTRHRLPPFTQNGILLVDKPKGWTSHDVVGFFRARFNAVKVGHCGTLDPAATGLLVIVFGKFTKFSQKFSGEDKVYEGTALLGTRTDSQDMDGTVLSTVDTSHLTVDQVREAFLKFQGDIMQTPPMVSAVKHNGERLYDLARKGVEVQREPKPITIHSITFKKFDLPYVDFEVACSKGTYIRTLCADVGDVLGCGAALYRLNRLRSGDFELKDAVDIETVKTWEQEELKAAINDFLFNKLSKMPKFSF